MLTLLASLGCTSAPRATPPQAVAAPKEIAPPLDDTGEASRMPLCINEFMPKNGAALRMPDGTPDWLELHNPSDEAISLDGWGLTDDLEKPYKHAFDPELSVPARGYLLLFATGDQSLGDRHLGFKLSSAGGIVALYSPLEDGQVVNYGLVERDFSVTRSTDCCMDEGCLEFDFRGTPGFNNLATQGGAESMVFAGSSWSWSNAYASGWHEAGFDDSAWPAATAPLGFGQDDLVGQIDGGPEGARLPTVFLRTTFNSTSVEEVTHLKADLRVDDGLRIWLNGQVALEENLPAGANETSWASVAVGAPHQSLVIEYALDPSLLVEGENTVAIELHQGAATSSDLGFDLSLIGQRR